MMKEMQSVENAIMYEAPQVEVIEVEVEKGFAASPLENPIETDPTNW